MTKDILFNQIESILKTGVVDGKYLIILNNGDYFTLCKKSTVIPEFNMCDIVYAHKYLGCTNLCAKYFSSDLGYVNNEEFDYEETVIETYNGINEIETIVNTYDEKTRICIDKIRTTVEYLMANIPDTIKNDDDYREYKFFNSGACTCYVRIGDKFFILNSETKNTDAEFVFDNIDKIDYYYIINEDFDTVVGDIIEFQKKYGIDNLETTYYKCVEHFNGKFNENDLVKYLNGDDV